MLGGPTEVLEDAARWGVRLKPDLLLSVRVSLTMIVKNEERNLPRCLESVRSFR